MRKKIVEKQPGCIQQTLYILGDKWTALIIRDLSTQPARFGDLEKSLTGISPRTLSQRLDMLEEQLIIVRRLYCERPPRYTYELTQKGNELRDIVIKMADWGAHYASDRMSSNS